jgi:hypothetical protein
MSHSYYDHSPTVAGDDDALPVYGGRKERAERERQAEDRRQAVHAQRRRAAESGLSEQSCNACGDALSLEAARAGDLCEGCCY